MLAPKTTAISANPNTIHYRDLKAKASFIDAWIAAERNAILAPSMLLQNASRYFDDVRHFDPQLVISDFDSYAYFFAKRFGLPILSIDNQQLIHKCKHDKELRRGYEADFQATRAFVKAKLPGCEHYVVTYFCEPEVRKKFEGRVTIVPPILRPEILAAKPTRGEHVLVYQTSTSDAQLIAELNKLPARRFVVYGLRRDAVEGNCVLKSFSEEGFVRDLASSRAVVTNGVLSLIHEAIYLGKPIFSVPVRHAFEQELNARYLERMGYGLCAPRTDAGLLDVFLGQEKKYAERVARHRQEGNRACFKVVDKLIEKLA
jgi:uncharacterized protein (TIGR00661 family)